MARILRISWQGWYQDRVFGTNIFPPPFPLLYSICNIYLDSSFYNKLASFIIFIHIGSRRGARGVKRGAPKFILNDVINSINKY